MGTPVVERMDHLGIVAGVCDEIGLVEYFDAQDTHWHARVSLGQAVKAMILNGLGFSNRRLYLFPQFFANKPVEELLGLGITADDLNDDCLDRALDWLYQHDVTPCSPASRRRHGPGGGCLPSNCTSIRPPLR
jgi:transposase